MATLSSSSRSDEYSEDSDAEASIEKEAAYALDAANGKERKLGLTIRWFVIASWLFRGARVIARRDKA